MALTVGPRGPAYDEADPTRYRQSLPPGQRSDDYFVETESEADRPAAGLQAVRVLQAVLIAVIALLSLAVFWMIGLIVGIF